MRNANGRLAGTISVGTVFFIGLFGCAGQPSKQMVETQNKFTSRDYAGTQLSADALVAKTPSGPEAAQAYYLKGRALEETPADNATDARARLQEARSAYIAALKADGEHGPLEGLIRASLSNVSYWQEDYTTAAQQGLAAGPLLKDPTAAAWTYYRAGLSQQRLGQFTAADAAFTQAAARAPGLDPAIRAQAHKGIRAFNIRILFDRPASAAAAATEFSKKGMPVARHDKTEGAEAELLVGAFNTYAGALTARAQLLPQYPNAVVVP